MEFLKDIVEKIFSIELIQLKKYIYIFFGFILFLIFGIEFLFFFKRKSIYLNEKKIVEFRNKINSLIARKVKAESKKLFLDKLLNENPSFRIKEYLINILKKNNLLNNSLQDYDSIRELQSKIGYKEFSINFDLFDLTTKQLLIILSEIESDQKVLFREINVKLNEDNKKVDLSAVLSTIKFA